MQNKYSRFFALLKQTNQTKEEVISNFTNGRTDSLRGLYLREFQEMERQLIRLSSGNNTPANNHVNNTGDKQRKAIIAIFKSIGKTTENAKAWAEKYGVKGEKKNFNDYTNQELYILIRNAEKMKADFIKSVNKKVMHGV